MKTSNLRQAVLLVVLFVGLLGLMWLRQQPTQNKVASRTEPRLETDGDNRPIAAILKGPQFGDDDLLRLVGVPWLQRIVLAESRVTSRSLERLQQLPKIRSLDLSGTSLTDDDFRPITQLTTLTELFLNNCPWLKDEHLAQLAKLKQLKTLELSSPEITAQGLLALEQFPELTTLVIGDCSDFGDDVIATFARLPQLKIITLASTGVSSQTVFALRGKLPKVKVKADLISLKDLRLLAGKGHLSDDGTSFTASDTREALKPLVPGDMTVISSIAPLERLNLKGPITDEMFLELKPAPQLRHLQLLDSLITDDGLEHLAQFPQLKSLSMFPTRLTGRGLVHLRHTPQLEDIGIRVSQGDEVLEHFAPLEELREIVIDAPITDDGLQHLPFLPKLRSFWMNQSRVKGSGLGHLAKQPELISLGLGHSLTDDTAVDEIAKLSALKFVSVSGTKITEDGKSRLKMLRPDISIH